jgi:hypothetical protein
MRLRKLGWVSLTCVVAALGAAAGCKIMPDGDGDGPSDKPEGMIDPHPGSTQGKPGDFNGQPPTGDSRMGQPMVRKLALDLNGVAGFAILDQDGDSSDATLGASSGAGMTGSAPAGASSAMWLSSSAAGQVLQAPHVSLDTRALQKTILGRRGMGTGQVLGATRGFAAQEDPGAPTPPTTPSGGDPAAPAPGDGSGADGASAAEQAGLLKITQDGDVVPALVALEQEPVEGQSPAADAGAPQPAPSIDPSNGSAGAAGAGAAGEGAGAAGAGNVGPDPSATGSGGMPGTNGSPPMGPAPYYEPLPRVTAVGLSPDGSVYILFEHSFFYRQPSAEDLANGFNPNAMGSPYRCQLFRANGNWQEAVAAQAPLAELECVTNQYEVRTWDARRVMQFDASGKLYFRAAAPGQPQEIFYEYNPETRELSEKVNGNICWRDVQVTPRGSLFYTGISGTNGDCSGTSFFRYVSADNRLTEIARDWWNFKYLAEQDPEDPTNERIIFYGPDPNATGGSGWESACLYRYNPALSDPAARTQKLVECSSNPINYVYGGNNVGPGQVSDENLSAFGERCQSEGQLFVGGEGVTGLSQLEDGTLFVVGKFQKKLAGEVHCGIDVNVDHCDSLDPAHTTEEACVSASHQWLRAQPYCSNPAYQDQFTCSNNGGQWNNGVGFRHYDATGAACLTPQTGFSRGYIDCRAPGQNQTGPQPVTNLTQEVNGLAYLVPSTDTAPAALRLLSDPAEEVERYWALEGENGPELYYSVYNAGQYNLRLATQVKDTEGNVEVQRRLVLQDFEVYNLQRDPAHANRVLFDALQFSTNAYLFGSVDTTLPTPEEVQASVQAVQGVSGRVETLIVLPNF